MTMRPWPRNRARPTRIGVVLERVYPAPTEWPSIKAFAAWNRGLPKRVVENARPVRLDRGVLLVHVTSPTWSQELSLLAPQLLARIAKEPGAARVHALRFRVGKLPEVDLPGVVPKRIPRRTKVMPEDTALRAQLESLRDEGLRETIAAAIEASRRTE